MPELPEVEVTRRGLLPHLPNRTVTSIWSSGKALRQGHAIPEALLREHICHQQCLTVDRLAKYLLIRMQNTACLVIHLGMTGKLGISTAEQERAKHDHLILSLDNHCHLRFNDTRRFGRIMVWPGDQALDLEQKLKDHEGIEPLGRDFTAEKLQHMARGKKVAIKNFLMDSRRIAGIGNIYANETLFAAGTHPAKPVGQVSLQQWQKIVRYGKEILTAAIEAGGTTIIDFISSTGRPGYFQIQLAVYGKKGQSCPGCQETIEKMTLGGRSTWFCPHCQK